MEYKKIFSNTNIIYNNYTMNTIAKQIMSKGYLVAPICKKSKIPAMKDFKNYSHEKALEFIKEKRFSNNDIAIVLNRNICCIDIDDDGLITSDEIYKRLCKKIVGFVNNPTEKTKHGYHVFFECNNEKLTRNVQFMNPEFLNIEFDKEKYDKLDEKDKKEVTIKNGKYKLPIDFLIGYHNGTNAYVRTAPSTNIKSINELPYITQLKPLPTEIIQELELVSDKTLSILKKMKNDNYIPPKYTEQQINKVRKYIKYLDQSRFNNMNDFFKVTSCIHNISELLIDEWLEKCKLSILWNEETSYEWCKKFFFTSHYKGINLGSFCHFLKKDNPIKYEEFIKEKDIIDVSDIISKIENVDLDNHQDENGYLKTLPSNKDFMAVISPLGSGKTYQIKKLIENQGINKKILLIVGRCSLGCEFTYKVFKDLNFQYYKDVKDYKTCDRLVIQADSLCKLYTKGKEYLDNIFDWVIADECELISDRLCEINSNKHECIFYLNWCLKYCKKIILADGQLSQNVINIFSDVRGKKPFIVRNNFNRNTEIKHDIYYELKNKISMPKFDNVLNLALDDVKNGKKLYIVCNEKLKAKALKNDFLKYTKNVYCFNGDTLEHEKKELCMNLNENATKYDVFITTSVLLAGNSIDKKHFDKCYVFISDKSDTPKSIHQMIKRVRNLKDCEIISHICYHEHIDHIYDLIDINQWMKSASNYMNEPNNWFNAFDYNENGILEHKKNIYFDLYCRYKQQQMNKQHCFLSWYVGLCYENKYNVNIINKIQQTALSVNVHKNNKKIVTEDHFSGIADVEMPSEEEYEALKLNSYNIEDQYKKEKFILGANYQLLDKVKDHDETLNDFDFVKKYYHFSTRNKHKFLRNIAYTSETYDKFIEYINNTIVSDASCNDNKKHYQDIEKWKKEINGLNDVVKLIGFKNFGDLENKIIDGNVLKNEFEKNKTEILKMYSILYYQIKLDKKDFSQFDFSKFIQSFNFILEELTSGKFKNVSKSKTTNINYKKYQFKHEFQQNEHDDVHEAIRIKFKPFEENNDDIFQSINLLEDDE